MFNSHLTRSVQITVAMGALGALVAVTPARAFDQSAWLQEQLAASDGGSYPPFTASETSAGARKADVQSVWLEEQLAISDGTGYGRFVTGPDGGKPYKMDAQSVWLQGQLAISDGSAPFDHRDAAKVYAEGSQVATASAK